jgi:F-type H+-transporting ATPase subunit delta
MSEEAIAKRYAQAIFELGVEAQAVSALAGDIAKVAEVYRGSSELRAIMNNPLVPESARLATIAEIAERLHVSPLAKNALGLLTQRKRLFALPAIARELDRLADERAGIVRATAVSAHPLPEAFAQKLQRELETMTGKKVALERRHDPALLAGLVIHVGDRVIDGSARTRLNELKNQLRSA